MPPNAGLVLLAQPLSPPGYYPRRPLPRAIVPTLYVVYDIQTPEVVRRAIDAGPGLFQDPSVEAWHILLRRSVSGPQATCLHKALVGPSEDLATAILRKYVAYGKVASLDLRARQLKSAPMAFFNNQTNACHPTRPNYLDLRGKYMGQGHVTWTHCADSIFNVSYNFTSTVDIYRQANGNFNARFMTRGQIFGILAVEQGIVGAIYRPDGVGDTRKGKTRCAFLCTVRNKYRTFNGLSQASFALDEAP